MMRGVYTKNDDEFLCRSWGMLSAKDIGRALGGRSKNSVLGRAHRLGLRKLQEGRPGVAKPRFSGVYQCKKCDAVFLRKPNPASADYETEIKTHCLLTSFADCVALKLKPGAGHNDARGSLQSARQ